VKNSRGLATSGKLLNPNLIAGVSPRREVASGEKGLVGPFIRAFIAIGPKEGFFRRSDLTLGLSVSNLGGAGVFRSNSSQLSDGPGLHDIRGSRALAHVLRVPREGGRLSVSFAIRRRGQEG